jgi:hypothetical protein
VPIRIFVVDDHPVVRQGIAALVYRNYNFSSVPAVLGTWYFFSLGSTNLTVLG